jgi:hypothetical protein
MRLARHVNYMVEMKYMNRNLSRKSERRRSLGRPQYKWKDNIKMDVREIGLEDVDWIHVAWDRGRWWTLVTTVMNFWFRKRGRVS